MIITKGDLLDQHDKLRRSGLREFFHHVEVANHKNLEVYSEILTRHDILPEDFFMVGNSLRSDILPVLEPGGTAIYIPNPSLW